MPCGRLAWTGAITGALTMTVSHIDRATLAVLQSVFLPATGGVLGWIVPA